MKAFYCPPLPVLVSWAPGRGLFTPASSLGLQTPVFFALPWSGAEKGQQKALGTVPAAAVVGPWLQGPSWDFSAVPCLPRQPLSSPFPQPVPSPPVPNVEAGQWRSG